MDLTKYFDFTEGLQAGLDEVGKYYEQTATSNAHIMAMCKLYIYQLHLAFSNSMCTVLDPAQRLTHVHTYWEEEAFTEAMKYAEDMVHIAILSFQD